MDTLRVLYFDVAQESHTLNDDSGRPIADGRLVKIAEGERVAYNNFPMAVLLNWTADGDNEINRLSFAPQTNISSKDNGASFDIELTNPKRKRVST